MYPDFYKGGGVYINDHSSPSFHYDTVSTNKYVGLYKSDTECYPTVYSITNLGNASGNRNF